MPDFLSLLLALRFCICRLLLAMHQIVIRIPVAGDWSLGGVRWGYQRIEKKGQGGGKSGRGVFPGAIKGLTRYFLKGGS